MEQFSITVRGKVMTLELGHTEKEWNNKFQDDAVWDIDMEDFITGAVDVNEDIVYWYIYGRCYETDIESSDFEKHLRMQVTKWDKETIDNIIEGEGGNALILKDMFPYNDSNLQKINLAWEDEEGYTDSELCDLLVKLAYEQVIE